FVAAAVTLIFAGVALAQGAAPTGSTEAKPGAPAKSTAKPAEKKSASKVKTATGELTAADANAGTAKLKSKDKELTFTEATPNAKESLGKVKVGDTVKVAYAESEGKLTLRSIARTKPPTTAKPAETKPAEKMAKPAETKPATK
ncbi:MAG: hypothetical protein ACREQP_02325, partial [Candidatus Binatia bacterium]